MLLNYKQIILTILFCFPSSVTLSQDLICKYTGLSCSEVNYQNLLVNNNLYYEKFKDSPFTGISVGKKQGSIVNGKKNGLWTIFFDTGEKKSIGKYKNNKKQGEWVTYHINGLIKTKGIYKDDKRHGDWVELDQYGTESFRYLFKKDNDLKGSGKFVRGFKVDENGKKIFSKKPISFNKHLKTDKDGNFLYKNTSKLFSGLYSESSYGTTYITSVKNGKKNGLEVRYNKNYIRIIKNYVNGKDLTEGVYARYEKNGNLDRKYFFKDGEIHGISLHVHKNGNIEERILYENGKAKGELLQYHENGRLAVKGFYQNGQLEGLYEEFDEDGSLIASTMYKNGKKVKK